ncbi:MAG: ClbS/DfsB family four-helix bundle protein [Chloroflexia bacterium]|nr:ClbS/DfsB family four-helix bundle protein [Chloroflexia bacterium]
MSTEQGPPQSKAELERRLDESWSRLEQRIGEFDDRQLTGPQDPAGWAAKDHLMHLAAWERSMVFLLQGKPRHEGLGVDEAVYLDGGDDAINAVIQSATKDVPLTEVLALLRSTHEQLRALVSSMSDDDPRQPYSHFRPAEPGEDSGEPILGRISGNGDAHFVEHLGYIEAIVRES